MDAVGSDEPTPGVPVGERAYYSISQAMAILGVSRASLWRWIRDGRLPAAKLGHRTIRINPDDLDRLIAHHRTDCPRSMAGAAPARLVSSANRTVAETTAGSEWWEMGERDHLVQFYQEDAFLLDAVADYIGAALQAGDAGVIVATPVHQVGLEERLAARGLDLIAARAAGQLLTPDAAATLARLMDGKIPDPERFFSVIGELFTRAAHGGRRVRVFGEMVALLVAEGNSKGALRLEHLWNELQQTRSFSLFCGYPLNQFAQVSQDCLVQDVCNAHTRVVPAESFTALPDRDDRLRAIALLQQKAEALEAEIAERKRIEQELRRTEAELRDMFEHATVGVHWVDPSGIILWANPAELAMVGYTASEYVGHYIGEFYVDLDLAVDILNRLTNRETLRDREARIRCKDGAIKDVVLNSSVLWDGDRFVHTRCFTIDITRRKRAEQGMRFLSEMSSILASSLDDEIILTRLAERVVPTLADWCVVDVVEKSGQPRRLVEAHEDPNKVAWVREVGRRYPSDQPSGDGVGKVLRTGRSELYVNIADDLRTLADRDPDYARILRDLKLTSVMIVPIVVDSRILGTITLIGAESGRRYDTEDLKLAEELAYRTAVALGNARLHRTVQEQMAVHVELNASLRAAAAARDRALADLQQLLRARDEFLSAAAHDLKTPLANMKGQAQLMGRRVARTGSVDVAQVLQGLTAIDASTTRMVGLVNDLLDTAHLQLGRPLELRKKSIDLIDLAKRVVADCQQATERHHLGFDPRVSALVGDWDRERLERALGNLLENAVKYSPDGGDIAVIADQVTDSGGQWAVVAVRDQGIGIPPSDLPRVFERFYRGTNVTGRIDGTGIGLTGVQSIVESHGGKLTVSSVEGAGTTFTLYLPLRTEEADAAHSSR